MDTKFLFNLGLYFVIGGLLFGIYLWRRSQRRFKDLERRDEDQ